MALLTAPILLALGALAAAVVSQQGASVLALDTALVTLFALPRITALATVTLSIFLVRLEQDRVLAVIFHNATLMAQATLPTTVALHAFAGLGVYNTAVQTVTILHAAPGAIAARPWRVAIARALKSIKSSVVLAYRRLEVALLTALTLVVNGAFTLTSGIVQFATVAAICGRLAAHLTQLALPWRRAMLTRARVHIDGSECRCMHASLLLERALLALGSLKKTFAFTTLTSNLIQFAVFAERLVALANRAVSAAEARLAACALTGSSVADDQARRTVSRHEVALVAISAGPWSDALVAHA